MLAEISPLVRRRLQVADSTTPAELHQVLQVVSLGWDDDYLRGFTVHGLDCGTTGGCHAAGAAVHLDALGLRHRPLNPGSQWPGQLPVQVGVQNAGSRNANMDAIPSHWQMPS